MVEPAANEVRMNISEVKQQFSKLINQVAQGRTNISIEKSGLPVATIISIPEYERFLRYEAEQARRFEVFDRLSAALADVPVEEIEAEVARTIAATRERRRAEALTPV